jgi:hypothetical protein
VKTKATMQSNQTERNALGRSLPGALPGAIALALNTMKNISGNWSLKSSAIIVAAVLYPAAKSSIPAYAGKTSKGNSDWKYSIRGDHSPCRYG